MCKVHFDRLPFVQSVTFLTFCGIVSEYFAQHQFSLSSYTLGFRPSLLLSIFTVPFHLIANIFRFILNVLRIPFPRFNLSTLHFHRSQQRASGNPERWVRELEEETGAVCISRSSINSSTKDAQSSATEPGPSSRGLVPRTMYTATGGGEEGRKLLPDFSTGSYEAFLKTCQKEAKIGCVILVSEEHDDVAEFKRCSHFFVLLKCLKSCLGVP
jgi:FAS-associated factor 2